MTCLVPQVLHKLHLSGKDSSLMTFWTDSRDVLVTVALLYCTGALHKISSNEITKEEVAAQKKKKKKFHFAVMGLPSFPLNAAPQVLQE